MLKILLFPFAVLYDVITRLRNYAYDRDLRPSVHFEVPVISVGNLTVGGTGKTPMVEHLVRLLKPTYRLATLSRGYGRKTKGFRLASAEDTPATLGDEPFQIYTKYGHEVTVSVGEERALAIPNILQERDDVGVILLDDAFQHRKVRPSVNIMLSDYHRPFYNDYLLPAGRLRESRRGAQRADMIVVTKCPAEIQDDEMMSIEHAIRRYADKPVFFSTLHYGDVVPFGRPDAARPDDVLLLTGIADASPLVHYISRNFRLREHLAFRDHHAYTAADVATLQQRLAANPTWSIITTEKDMVKLVALGEAIRSLPIFYLPIEVQFLKSGLDFDEMVLNSIQRDV